MSEVSEFQTAVMKGLFGHFCARKRAGRLSKRIVLQKLVKMDVKSGQYDSIHCKKTAET